MFCRAKAATKRSPAIRTTATTPGTSASSVSQARHGPWFLACCTGFPIGGVPPIGHVNRLRVFIDPDLLRHEVVWAAAGTWHDVFPLHPNELQRVSGGIVVEIKRG